MSLTLAVLVCASMACVAAQVQTDEGLMMRLEDDGRMSLAAVDGRRVAGAGQMADLEFLPRCG